jgi:hypothetical protein
MQADCKEVFPVPTGFPLVFAEKRKRFAKF